MTTARAPRVAVVGVRRVHTGLGQFIAKHLVAAGAEVPAFIASRPETIEEGRASLRRVGIDAQGFVDLDALLDAHPVDALVVASPHETHRAWLEAAIAHGLHVLCEKPLVWGSRFPADDACKLVEMATARELVIFENCPWPYALPAFDRLHPGARAGMQVVEFEMSPSSSSPREMLVDTMSHPLSILQNWVVDAESRVSVRNWHRVEQGHIELLLLFDAATRKRSIRTIVRLTTVPTQPRPMAIVIDERRAERRVQMPDYAMTFADGAREVPLPDPMAALVRHFVRVIRDGEPPDAAARRSRAIVNRLAMLHEIVSSFPGP